MDIIFEYPSKVAAMLLKGEADIGLIPVAVIPALKEHYIIADFGISTEGEVASVCLFSDVPFNEVEKIYLDYQSRTSVALLKILLKDHWNISPQLLPANAGYESLITGTIAGLVIGDRALIQRNKSKYIYDLGSAWNEMTGLPFVFAVWVANKKLPADFIRQFNDATGEGLNHIDEIASEITFPDYDLKKYYSENINYRLGDKHHEGLKLFLNLLSS